MTAPAPILLRLALGLSAVVCAWAGGAAAFAAEPAGCTPEVEGPAALVAEIAERTRALSAESCRPLVARIVEDGDGLRVERLEAGRVVETRRVEGRATAVTLVVSWARAAWMADPTRASATEGGPSATGSSGSASTAATASPSAAVSAAGTLSSAPAPAGSASARALPLGASTAPVAPAAVPDASGAGAGSARPPLARVAVVTRVGLSLAEDASLWADVTVGACGALGPICLGGYVRAPFDVLAAGPARDLATSRGGLDGLLGADLPLVFDRLAFRPGLAAGAGWLRGSGSSPATSLVVRDVAVARVSAFARLGVALAGPAWLEMGALADLAPNAPTDVERQGDVELPGFPLFRAGLDASFRLEIP